MYFSFIYMDHCTWNLFLKIIKKKQLTIMYFYDIGKVKKCISKPGSCLYLLIMCNIYTQYKYTYIHHTCMYIYNIAPAGAQIEKRSLSWLQTCALTSNDYKKNIFFIYVSRGHTDVIWKSPGKAKTHEHWTWTTIMPV